jgi:hypothetical protein
MFSHRLKIELRENRIYILIWALVLLTLTIAAILLWRSAPVLDPVTSRLGSPSPDLIALLLLPLVALLIVTTITSFRQDNLKDPQTFWNTRPVRPRTLHRTKFIFLHLLFTLPLTLCTFIVSINATTMSTSLIYAAESALWSAAAIHLCALCCLHNHQWARLPILPALGFLGFILVALIVSKLNIAQPGRYNPGRFSVNTLFITLILLFLFALAGFHLIKKPGTTYPLWMPFLIGALTFPLLTATWLPDNFSKSTEAQQYQPSEPLTTFSNSNSSINRQYFYDLNYPLIDLMGNQDRIPINLLSQRIDSAPLSQFPSGIRAELKYWSSGMDPLDGPQNLQTIAQPFDRLAIYGSPKPFPVLSKAPPFAKDEEVNGELTAVDYDQEFRTTTINGQPVRWFKECGSGGADGAYYSTTGFSVTDDFGKTGYYRLVVEGGDDMEAEVARRFSSVQLTR